MLYAFKLARRMKSPNEPDGTPSPAVSRKIPNEPGKPSKRGDSGLGEVGCWRGFLS
jgi:hypothetical protein